MKQTALLLAALVLCASTLAFADDATPATAPAATSDSDQDKIVCRKGEPITGSRFPGPSVCHTQREWDQIRRDSGIATNHMEMQGVLHNPQSK